MIGSRYHAVLPDLRIGICAVACALGCWGQTAAGSVPPVGEKSGGAIEGRVVQRSTGQPLAGVDIFVMNFPVPPVKTGTDGSFLFQGLKPGRYGVVLSPASNFRAREAVVDVRENQKVTGITIHAFSGAVIAGQVLDTKRRPIAGLGVSALRLTGGGPRFPPDRGMTGIGVTNDLGEYRISGLTPGSYAILVESARCEVKPKEWKEDDPAALPEPVDSVVRTYYPNATALDLAATIPVIESQKLEQMDVTLATLPTVCVRSRLRRQGAGDPPPVRIRLVGDLYMGGATLAEGEIRPGSGFEICGLPPGGYVLMAGPVSQAEAPLYGYEAFTITNRSIRLPDLELRPLVALSGRLSIEPPASDATPLTGPISVMLTAHGRPGIPDERRMARVNEPGAFVIPALLPAEYWLTVRTPPGYYVKSATMDGTDALRQPLHALGRELHIVVGRDAAQVSVAAVTSKNEPIAFASVIVGIDPLPPSYAPSDQMSGICDQNGRAEFTGLAPGKYRVVVLSDTPVDPSNPGALFLGYRQKGEALTLGPGEHRSLQVRAADRKD
jgi:hypothetical protein